MMADIVNCLWFDKGEARKAAAFYTGLFPGGRIDGDMAAPGDYPAGREGDALTVSFTLLGRRFLALNGGPGFGPSQAVSFMVETADQAETDRYWDALVGQGGAESRCGWCTDRWGFSWQITPRALIDGLADPDPAVARRVFAAMMTMRRIDVAAIEAARRGAA